MRAVVLVGGFGTRMRPLTNHVPKPMLPVGHEPMISRLVGRLVEGGVTDVTLALGFKAEPFLEAFPDGSAAATRLDYAVEPEPLDTAGAIRFAAEHAGIDDTFVVANGDIITDLDVSTLLAAHRASGAEATIHLTPVDDPSSFGIVEIDGDGRVERFVEKPAAGTRPSNLINAGTYVLEPSVVELIPPGRPVSIEREIFPDLVERAGLYGAGHRRLLDRRRSSRAVPAGQPRPPQRTPFGACRTASRPAPRSIRRLRSRLSLIGPGAVVAEGASVIDSVVLPGASVGPRRHGRAVDRHGPRRTRCVGVSTR